METVRSPKKSTYDIGSGAAMLAFLIILIVMITGCANVTVVKLAEMCHMHEGKPSVSFVGESGKVDCHP